MGKKFPFFIQDLFSQGEINLKILEYWGFNIEPLKILSSDRRNGDTVA